MIQELLHIQLPLLMMVAGGIFFGYRKLVEEHSLVVIVTDFFMPLLIVEALRRSTLSAVEIGSTFWAVAVVVSILSVVALIFARLSGSKLREVALPVIFPNTGFLGIPLLYLWGGADAGSVAIIFDTIMGIPMVIMGLALCTGSVRWRSLLQLLVSPLFLAVVVGFILSVVPGDMPRSVDATLQFAGGVAPPVAAFAVGVTLGQNRPEWSVRIFAGVLVRFLAGAVAGFSAAWVLGLSEVVGSSVIVLATLPSAVFSYVLPARYGVETGFARSMVAYTTVLGVLCIPVLMLFL